MPLSFPEDVMLKARSPTISALANSVKNGGELLAPKAAPSILALTVGVPLKHIRTLKGIKMLSRVACAFSRPRFRQQQVLRGGSREGYAQTVSPSGLGCTPQPREHIRRMRQVRRVPGVRESEPLCPIDSTCELAHDLREPRRAVRARRQEGRRREA